MQFVAAIIGGTIGGLIGAGIWLAISYLTHFEIAWIAWVVGVFVGLGVRLGADKWEGIVPGAVAILLSLAAVLGGKYVSSEIVLPVAVNLDPTEQDVKNTMARTIINDFMAKRVALDWPKGNSGRQIQSQLDHQIYPLSVIAEVEKRWKEMNEDQRKEMIRQEKERINAVVKDFKDNTRKNFVQNNLRIVDYIFFALAAITAYRIGSGSLTKDR